MLYTTPDYKKITEIIASAENKSKMLQTRYKELDGLIAQNNHSYETYILTDDPKLNETEILINELEKEKEIVEKKLNSCEHLEVLEVLKRDQNFTELLDNVRSNNKKEIADLQVTFNENDVELKKLKDQFLKLVIQQGIIAKKSYYLSRELNEIKDKSDNRLYSGISIGDLNLILKTGSIFISDTLCKQLYEQMETHLDAKTKEMLHHEINNYSK